MKDSEGIERDDFLFGIGITISEVIYNYLEKISDNENDIINICELEEDESEPSYEEEIEDLRNICKNEEFSLISTKYFFPIAGETKHYSVFENDEFILIKDVNFDKHDDKEQQKEISGSLIKFKNILKYFKLDNYMGRLNYYFYFPERVIINSHGKGLCDIKVESEWEHYENYGEHKH